MDLLLREKEALSGATWKRSLSFRNALDLGLMFWKRASVSLGYHSARAECKGMEDELYMSKRKAGDLQVCFFGGSSAASKTPMEQGHVNWSLMGHRPFSIYQLTLQTACDRTPDGVQMWRGFAWTFSCSQFPRQLLNSEKPRFIATQTTLLTLVNGESTKVLGLQPRKRVEKGIHRRVYILQKSGSMQSVLCRFFT